LFKEILGGKISLAPVGKFPALVNGFAGGFIAVVLGLALIILAFRLPGAAEDS